MSEYISPKLRLAVVQRANYGCEYCLIPERFSFFKFYLENLANSCSVCNENKGSDIATFVGNPEHIVRFCNPRIDKWTEHFKLDKSGEIIPLTNIGKATEKIFRFNHPDSIIERRELLWKGWKFNT